MKTKPVTILKSGQGEAYWAMTEKIRFKLGPNETGGVFSLAALLAQPGGGPPPHIHRREDEMFLVLDGEIGFLFGDRSFQRANGFAAYLPKNIVHTYNNVGKKPARLLVATVPPGFDGFIREWGKPVSSSDQSPLPPTQADIDRLMTLAPKYGIELCPDAQAKPDPSAPPPDRAYWVLGQLVTLKLTSKETGGNFTVAEVANRPGEFVPPHIHTDKDEIFYVTEGTFEFTLAARTERVGPDHLVFVPRGNLHGFRNVGTTRARMIDMHTPGGFEDFFIEAGVPATDLNTPPSAPPPDMDRLMALFRKHGMEVPVQ